MNCAGASDRSAVGVRATLDEMSPPRRVWFSGIVGRAPDRSVVALALFLLMNCGCGESGEAPTRPPGLDLPSPEAFLRGFAVAVGSEIDQSTGYPIRIRRVRDRAEMIWIAPSKFFMGARLSDPVSEINERPGHVVEITKPYYLDVNETTRLQFSTFADATGYQTEAEIEGSARGFGPKGWEDLRGRSWRAPYSGDRQVSDLGYQSLGSQPVVVVTQRDAKAYAKWVGASLPTEAQFECALGADSDGGIWPWGSVPYRPPPGFGNYAGVELSKYLGSGWPIYVADYSDPFPMTAPVQSFSPTRSGFYDLSGNVMEWCSDWYAPLYYAHSPASDPTGRKSGYEVCARGGSWCSVVETLRVSYRLIVMANHRSNDIGFRLARTVGEVR